MHVLNHKAFLVSVGNLVSENQFLASAAKRWALSHKEVHPLTADTEGL